jgi:hypothetical protein
MLIGQELKRGRAPQQQILGLVYDGPCRPALAHPKPDSRSRRRECPRPVDLCRRGSPLHFRQESVASLGKGLYETGVDAESFKAARIRFMAVLMLCSHSTTVSCGQRAMRISSRVTSSPERVARSNIGWKDWPFSLMRILFFRSSPVSGFTSKRNRLRGFCMYLV